MANFVNSGETHSPARIWTGSTLPIVVIATLLSLFLFLDFFEPAPILLVRELNNAGHIVLFFLLARIWLRFQFRHHERITARRLLPAVIGLTLLGAGIEVLQPLISRDFSFLDIFRNTCGILLALTFHSGISRFSKKKSLNLFRFIACLSAIVVLLPFFLALSDKAFQLYQYPTLSNFETPLESSRWSGNTNIRVVKHSTSNVLEVIMQPGKKYNKVELVEFHTDWSKKKSLSFEIFNVASSEQIVTVRIHDKDHLLGNELISDRFNRSFSLRPGWNKIRISLKEIEFAPEGRQISLSEIRNLQIFSGNVNREYSLLIDNVTLVD